MQIKQGVEKLYFGLLILQKQKEEAEIKLLLAKEKLKDVESAVKAGKATESAKVGLNAGITGEEQNLLTINIQTDDYNSDLKQLIGLPPTSLLTLNEISTENFVADNPLSIDSLLTESQLNNSDIKTAAPFKNKVTFCTQCQQIQLIARFWNHGRLFVSARK